MKYQTKTPLNEVKSSGESALKKISDINNCDNDINNCDEK